MIAIATLLVVVTLTLVVNRVGGIALAATGLSQEVAHLQARSALTGVGFTTAESELIVNHPVRRRILLSLMLVGNAGLVTIMATLVVGLAESGGTRSVLTRVGTLIGGLLVILFAARSKFINRVLALAIGTALRQFTTLDVRDYVQLLDLARNHSVAELGVESDSWLVEHRLADLQLPDEGVLVLGVRRADGKFIGTPRGHTRIQEHDTLVVYGYTDVLADLGTRKIGLEGDRAHAELISEVAERQAEEDSTDFGSEFLD